MEGRLAFARGDLRAAIGALTAAADIWQQAGYPEEESRARRALAHTLFLSGDVGGAEAQLRTLLQDAQER